MNRKLIVLMAPPAPRCFSDRSTWVEYLLSSQKAAIGAKVRPFIGRAETTVRFNLKFAACVDCPAKHAHQMFVAGRCDWRGYIASITPPEPSTAEVKSAT